MALQPALRSRPVARVVLLAVALALLAAVPASSAKAGISNPDTSTPVTLYMHLIDIQDFPINTQRPADGWTQSNAVGALTSTTTCLPNDTPAVDASTDWHTFYGYSSPSYVEYQIESGGKPRFHAERGISYDALLDQGTPFTLHWYMTTQNVDGADGLPDPSQVPMVVPNVVVSATIRAGDVISVDDRAYNQGVVLVEGATEPATLAGPQVLPGLPGGTAPPTVTALGQLPDGKWLFEFAVPMTIETPVIPRAFGYNLRIDVSMANPACATGPDAALMPNLVRIHSDKDHRPRMEFAVTDPLRIEALHPQFVGDDLVVHAAINAVWGNYDVAEPSAYTPDVGADGLQLSIEGPSSASSLALYDLVSHTNPHYMHQESVTLVYVWPYKVDRAEPGVYNVHLVARNDQGTAEATADTEFEIGRSGGGSALNCTLGTECTREGVSGGGEGRESPGAGAALGIGVLAAGGVALARRRR